LISGLEVIPNKYSSFVVADKLRLVSLKPSPLYSIVDEDPFMSVNKKPFF